MAQQNCSNCLVRAVITCVFRISSDKVCEHACCGPDRLHARGGCLQGQQLHQEGRPLQQRCVARLQLRLACVQLGHRRGVCATGTYRMHPASINGEYILLQGLQWEHPLSTARTTARGASSSTWLCCMPMHGCTVSSAYDWEAQRLLHTRDLHKPSMNLPLRVRDAHCNTHHS